jgi:hypothetical protein
VLAIEIAGAPEVSEEGVRVTPVPCINLNAEVPPL